MKYSQMLVGFPVFLLFVLMGCGGESNNSVSFDTPESIELSHYELLWETSFSMPEGFMELQGQNAEHNFQVDKNSNVYLSFGKKNTSYTTENGLEEIAIWKFDSANWIKIPELSVHLGKLDQGYYLAVSNNGNFQCIFFRDVYIGTPSRGTQTDSTFSTSIYDSINNSWSEFTAFDDLYLTPQASFLLNEDGVLYTELLTKVAVNPISCTPDWIDNCFTWEDKKIYAKLVSQEWVEIEQIEYDNVITDKYRINYSNSQSQIEILTNEQWENYGQKINGEYNIFIDKYENVPYLFSDNEVMKSSELGWDNIIDGFDFAENHINAIYFDSMRNLIVYSRTENFYSIYCFEYIPQASQ